MFKFIPDFPDTIKGPFTGRRYGFNPPIIISPKGYWWRKLINTILRVICPNTLFPLRVLPYPKLDAASIVSVQPMTAPSNFTLPMTYEPKLVVDTETIKGCFP
jgi:hypothetical protein